jgi:Spy/CpxP family protein refolding chaperone
MARTRASALSFAALLAASAPLPAAAQSKGDMEREQIRQCVKQADDRNLTGAAREKFLADCLKATKVY